jgi:hypothetical protein
MIAEHDWWEYTDFVYAVWPRQGPWCQLDLGAEELQAGRAQHYFWRRNHAEIEAALKLWHASGWEPMETVGPDAIKLTKTLQKRSGFDPVRLLFWCLTLGVALIIDWLFTNPIIYVVYEPVEFRVKMRRFTRTERLLESVA